MPNLLTLLVFAPCEKVIVGEDDHLTSMIALMERVNIQVSGQLPADAIFPLKWSVCALWHRAMEVDPPRMFEQKFQILRPDGEEAAHALSVFAVTNDHQNFRNVLHLNAFPIGLPGAYRLRLALREKDDPTEWQYAAEYPLEVFHEITAEPSKKESSNEVST